MKVPKVWEGRLAATEIEIPGGKKIIVVSVYLVHSLGAMGDNVTLLSGLAAFVEQLQYPLVIGGDWQMEADELG